MTTDLKEILLVQPHRGHSPDGVSLWERIFDLLCVHPYGLTSKELSSLWNYREDGGPLSSYDCITQAIHRFNKRAKRAGLGIRIRGSGGPGSKWLIWIVSGKQVRWEAMWLRPFDYPERL